MASGHNVIDNGHPRIRNPAAQAKGLLHIQAALLRRQFGLGYRGDNALATVAVNGDVEGFGEDFCQFQTLVKAALSQATGMQWDGYDAIGSNYGGMTEVFGHQLTDQPGDGQLVLEF